MAQGTLGGTPIAELPASSFAYCEPGSGPVSERCHFPIRDKNGKADPAHVRNAMARMDQSPFGPKARAKIMAAAKECGIGGMPGKASFEMKAEPFSARKITRWLAGEIGRRILVVPFEGPLPGGKKGLDLDGEYFDEETDIFGPFPALKASRWRLMDWHHDDAGVPPKEQGGPAISMKGAIIGEIELEDEPDEFGHWASWWIRRGQANDYAVAAKRVAALETMTPIYGSSFAVYKKADDDGHISEWPLIRHTASTAPRNPRAVIPALKAVIDDITPADLTSDALKALLVGLTYLEPDLRSTFSDGAADPFPIGSGETVAKAGRVLARAKEQRLRDAIDEAIGRLVTALDAVVGAELAASPESEKEPTSDV